MPWDGDVPFFLGEFVNADHTPSPICPRQTLKRVLARAEKMGFVVMTGMEFEWFNFLETPQSWDAKQGVAPEPITPGMFGYSLLRMNRNREFMNALMDEMLAFGVPIEGLHTETGPGVYEVAIAFGEALEQADRSILFKTGAKEIGARFGIMPSFMAKWNAKYPGCSGHIHQSLKEGPDGKANLFYDAKSPSEDERAVRELRRRPGRLPDGVRADVLADHQQLQAPGRRLLGAGQADLGHRQPDGELSRARRQPEGDAPRDALPGRRRQSLPGDGGGDRRRPRRRREGAQARRRRSPAPTRAATTCRARRAR